MILRRNIVSLAHIAVLSCIAVGCRSVPNDSQDVFIRGHTFYVWGDFALPKEMESNRDWTRHSTSSVKRFIDARNGYISENIGPNVDYVIMGNVHPSDPYLRNRPQAELYYRVWDLKWREAIEFDIPIMPLDELYKRENLPVD